MYTWKTGKRFMKEAHTGPSFLIDQLVPATGITLLFGPPSCGKSTMLWTMAEAMRLGKPFLGRYRTAKALTLLLNLDMPSSAIYSRMKGANYEPRFHICDFANHLNITALAVTNPGVFQALAQRARRYQVIMIDSLSTITNGLSLKDDWVPGLTVAALRGLFPRQAIILLHHSRKQTMGQFGPIPPHREDALGSNLWMAMVQSELQMYLKGNHLAHLQIVKSQVAPEGEGDDVYVDDVGCRVLPYLPNDATQWLIRLSRAEQSAVALDATYAKKPMMERYDIVGKLLVPVVSAATVRRWVTRTKYQMIP
jgi:hypothetical protein